jgi:hypothetical protein
MVRGHTEQGGARCGSPGRLHCVTAVDPLPFYSLVRTRGPGTCVDPNKPLGLGAVLGRAQGPSGWEYAVIIGETTYSFAHDELEPLGVVLVLQPEFVIYGVAA